MTQPRKAERFNRGRSIQALFTSGFNESATQFRVLIPDAGDYILLLDNRLEARFPAEVASGLRLLTRQLASCATSRRPAATHSRSESVVLRRVRRLLGD